MLSQFQHLQLREIRSPKPAKEDLDPEGPLSSSMSLLKSSTSLLMKAALGQMQQQGLHGCRQGRIKAQPSPTKLATMDDPYAR